MAGRIDTRMLRMLVALADSASAAAAARRLNITPSALSHQLRKTEEMLAVSLFERSGRRSALTPLGEQLLASARLIVAELDQAEEKLERSRRGNKPVIRTSGGPYAVHRWFAPDGGADAGQWAHLDFVATVRGNTLPHSVATGELDIAFICGRNHHRGLTAVPLFVDDLVVALPKGHPLAQGPFVEARQLEGMPYLTYSQVVEPGLEDDLFFQPARFAATKVREVSPFSAILDLVAAGAGFSILSRWEMRLHRRQADLVPMPMTALGLKVAWTALVRSAEEGRPDLAAAIAFARESGRAAAD